MNKKNASPRSKKSAGSKQPRKDSRSSRVNYDNTRVSKFDKDIDEGPKDPRNMKRSSRSNDVSWYAHNPELLKSAASIPFSSVTGEIFPNYSTSVPGIMSIEYAPFVGQGDILSQAANQIYSDTVHANSRNQSYDAPDQMMVILAGANIFSMIALGLRAYGLMRRYEQMDKYTPHALIRASGFDPSDLQKNYSHMWFDLNQLIVQSRQLWIPNVMPLIERWYWMNSSIYMDGSSVKAQYYIFTPANYLLFSETASPQGTSLVSKPWAPNLENEEGDFSEKLLPHTWADYVTIVQSQIDAMIGSQDRGIIFGDILKAYGSERLYTISEISSDYTVEPVYDREVLSQIENMSVWNVNDRLYNGFGDVQQKDGRIYHNFLNVTTATTTEKWDAATSTSTCREQFLNFHQLETPTPEQVMVATRLKVAGTKLYRKSSQTCAFGPAIAGTEVPTRLRMWRYVRNSSNVIELIYTRVTTRTATKANLSLITAFQYISFDWAPAIYSGTLVSDIPVATANVGQEWYDTMMFAALDYDNYTLIDATTLSKMHTTAVYSEFGVPSRM